MLAGMKKRPSDTLRNLVGGKQRIGEIFSLQLQHAT